MAKVAPDTEQDQLTRVRFLEASVLVRQLEERLGLSVGQAVDAQETFISEENDLTLEGPFADLAFAFGQTLESDASAEKSCNSSAEELISSETLDLQGSTMPKDDFIALSQELEKTLEPITAVAPRIDALLQERIDAYRNGTLSAQTPEEYKQSRARLNEVFASLHSYALSLTP